MYVSNMPGPVDSGLTTFFSHTHRIKQKTTKSGHDIGRVYSSINERQRQKKHYVVVLFYLSN